MNSIYIVLLPTVLFALFVFIGLRYKRVFFLYLSSLYLSSFCCAYLIEVLYKTHYFSLIATIFLILIIFIMIVPLFFLKSTRICYVVYDTEYIFLKRLSYFIVIISLYSILFYLPYVILAFTGNVNFNRLNNSSSRLISDGYFTFFASVFANLFYLPQLLFFISLVLKWSKRLSILLLISSLSVVFNVLANVGRDGFVLWGLTFMLLYLIFKGSFSKHDLQFVNRVIVIFFISGIFLFSIITFSRFSTVKQYDYDIVYSLVDYQGQQLYNFNDSYDVISEIESTYYLTPNIKRILLKSVGQSSSNSDDIYKQEVVFDYYGISTFVFKTYVVDLLLNFGYFGTVTFALVFMIILYLVISNSRGFWSFSRILILILLVQIPLFGVYYFRQRISNYDLGVLFVLVFIFISRFYRKGKIISTRPDL